MGIKICIEVPNWLMFEGWCNVFHQFMKNLIIGILINLIQIKIKATSTKNSWKHSALRKVKNKINTKVKWTSHTQKVPHIGFPQKPLLIKVNNVTKAPILALVLENN
jgi:hypothetical protein